MFAQQSYNTNRPNSKLNLITRKISWSLPRKGTKVKPISDKKVTVQLNDDAKDDVVKSQENDAEMPPTEQKRKNTLTPR